MHTWGMSDEESPTSTSPYPACEQIDFARLPPWLLFELWWEDPYCKALGEFLARASTRHTA